MAVRRKRGGSTRREPSGRISRSGQTKEFAPALIKRLRDASMREMADPRWATELGRLFLDGRFNGSGSPAALFAAGEKWERTVRDYHRAINAQPALRAASLELRSHSEPPDPDSEGGKELTATERNAIAKMLAAYRVLCTGGKILEAVVRRVCEFNEVAAGYEIPYLVKGLTRLADHWELTGAGKHGRKIR
jgi:hypothetical protein